MASIFGIVWIVNNRFHLNAVEYYYHDIILLWLNIITCQPRPARWEARECLRVQMPRRKRWEGGRYIGCRMLTSRPTWAVIFTEVWFSLQNKWRVQNWSDFWNRPSGGIIWTVCCLSPILILSELIFTKRQHIVHLSTQKWRSVHVSSTTSNPVKESDSSEVHHLVEIQIPVSWAPC